MITDMSENTGEPVKKLTPYDIIAQILLQHADAPMSQSAAWAMARAETVGGSDVATILGLNPYRKRKDFIADKCGFGLSFEGNQATRWGTIMERATEKFTHAVLKMTTPIYAMGSLPTVINGQRYTPDGLGVVQLRNIRDEIKAFIAVFEFKSPARSVPDGKVPKHYAPQLQTGLLAIPQANIGIFTNCAFRKCKKEDFNFELTYDRTYHNGDARKFTKRQTIHEVFAIGKVYFTASQEEFKAFASSAYCEETEDAFIYNNDILDLGAASPRLTDRVFELATLGRLKANHSDCILNIEVINQMDIVQTHNIQHQGDPQNTNNLYNEWQGDHPHNDDQQDNDKQVAVMYWKLVRADIITMDRDTNWRAVIEPAVTQTLTDIREIKTAPDPYIEFQRRYGQNIEDPDDQDNIYKTSICGVDAGDIEL